MSEPHLPPERPYPLDHEGRIARLEGIVEQIDVRLGRIETDANREALETQIAANRETLEKNRRQSGGTGNPNRGQSRGTRRDPCGVGRQNRRQPRST